MNAREISVEELWEMLPDEIRQSARPTIERWLARGDGCAVYENVAMDSGALGHKQFTSYGSPAAQIEVDTHDRRNDPPQRMPDIGNAVNWSYGLVAYCRPRVVAVDGATGRVQ